MPKRVRAVLASALLAVFAAIVLTTARPAAAAGMTQVTDFGANPSNLSMYVYVPATVAPRPALLVLMHYCGGNAAAMFGGGGHDYVTAADRYGYVIVLPQVSTSRSMDCFDVSTPEGLRRGGTSDSTGIVSMVNYAKEHYHVDPARVVLSGFSSGAMMTNVMAAEYPDVFAAGAAFSGVPATCFATGSDTSYWNSTCSTGNSVKTAQQWGDAVRALHPGYTGSYPRMQLWHGDTDTTLAYPNFAEEIKEWTNLHGASQTPTFTDHPQATWTRTRYGDTRDPAPVEGISVAGVGHVLPLTGMIAYAVSFLGLDRAASTPPASTAPASGAPPTNAPAAASCTASYHTVGSWAGGFQGEVVVQAGTKAVNGWRVSWTLASGQIVSQAWNGAASTSGASVTVRNAPYNGTLSPSASTTFGFVANGTPSAPDLTCANS